MKTLLGILALAAFAMLLFGCIGQAGKGGASEEIKDGNGGVNPEASSTSSSTSSSLPPLGLSEDELPTVEEPDFSFEGSDDAITMPEK